MDRRILCSSGKSCDGFKAPILRKGLSGVVRLSNVDSVLGLLSLAKTGKKQSTVPQAFLCICTYTHTYSIYPDSIGCRKGKPWTNKSGILESLEANAVFLA